MTTNTELTQHLSNIEFAIQHLRFLAAERREEFDNKSDKWQESDAGSEENEFLNDLEQSIDELESAHQQIDDISDQI